MGQTPGNSGSLGRVERILLGLLAAVFLATLIGALVSPKGTFRLIADRSHSDSADDPSDFLGSGLRVAIAHVKSSDALRRLLKESRFDPEAIRVGQAPVPALFLASLPADLESIESVQERKDLFLGIVLPLILNHNSVILEQRAKLTRIKDQAPDKLDSSERNWLLRLARHYKVIDSEASFKDLGARELDALFRRVDAVPVSLALAQSAAESGWGTSRFALRGNALFGQWTWDEDAGLVPGDREEGRTHAVRAFKRLANSVRAYVHNLNVSQHYHEFRTARADLRRDGSPDGTWGHVLIGHLEKYSEEGSAYIEKIRSIIRVNGFGDFETAHIAAAKGEPRGQTQPGS